MQALTEAEALVQRISKELAQSGRWDKKIVTDRGPNASTRFHVVLERDVDGVTISASSESNTESGAFNDALQSLRMQAESEETRTRFAEREQQE
jgi:hypothetical protein